ncbi:MAG: metallophosphoesterase [Zestosphaera tikiterensis]|uniref:Metallophosphoesterase n=1 Tax=Zestosphaera tikiterensis TaxID=1973259 RepID=A0A2R7Y8X6_9CREN|nr:MAG: metallophosphoesterase [Zestosphaera tikiterensis]
MKIKLFTLALLSLLIINAYPAVVSSQSSNLSIPSITYGAGEIVAANIGPTAPAITSSGGSFEVVLRSEYASVNISTAYIWSVKSVGDSLNLLNYTVSVVKVGDGTYKVTLPDNVEEGLYDLVLVGSAVWSVPRSVWVVKEWPEVIRFVENTDLHFIVGSPDPFTGDMNRFTAFTINNLLKPDFVIWLGDIADNAASAEYVMAQAYRYSYLYSIPVLSIPGNHDYSAGDIKYPKYLGPTRWYRVIADKLLIIGIFSSEQGTPSWQDLAFAEGMLKTYNHIPFKAILVHHPPFYYQGELRTWYGDEQVLKPYAPGVTTPVSSYWSNNMTALRYFLKLVEDYNVTMVLSGHVHRDFFTKYTSVRTNTTTLFLTFTTTAHGAALYNGLSLMEFNLTSGELSFPIKPPTFIGFANSTMALASNSIPIGVTYTYMNVIHSKQAYSITMVNNQQWLNLTGRILWSLPWNGTDFNAKLALNNSGLKILSHRIVGDRLFLLIELNLPYKGSADLKLYLADDLTPPEITLKSIVPKNPIVNRSTTIYLSLFDAGWGIDPLNIKVMLGNKSLTYTITPQTYTSQFNEVYLTISTTVYGKTTMTLPLTIEVRDLAGNIKIATFNVTFSASATQTITTPSPTSTPAQPPTSTASITTSTTSPMTTPTTSKPTITTTTTVTTYPTIQPPTTSIASSTTSQPPTTTTVSTTSPTPPDLTPLIAVGVVAVLLILGLALILRKPKK